LELGLKSGLESGLESRLESELMVLVVRDGEGMEARIAWQAGEVIVMQGGEVIVIKGELGVLGELGAPGQ